MTDEAKPAATGELALLQECIQGNSRAWQTLVDEYGQAVYDAARYTLRRVLGSVHEEDVENVYQAVLLGLCEKSFHRLRLFKGRSSFKTWVTSVTARFALNYIRTEKRKGSLKFAQLDDQSRDLADSDRFDRLPSEEQDRLSQAMAKLPARDRLLLKLFYYDGLSYKTIADIVQMPVNSVSPSMVRAREALKKLVETASI